MRVRLKKPDAVLAQLSRSARQFTNRDERLAFGTFGNETLGQTLISHACGKCSNDVEVPPSISEGTLSNTGTYKRPVKMPSLRYLNSFVVITKLDFRLQLNTPCPSMLCKVPRPLQPMPLIVLHRSLVELSYVICTKPQRA